MNAQAPIATLLAAALLAGASAAKAESVEVGGVAASGNSQVAYLGHVAALPGQSLADGFAWSLFTDYVRYRYDQNSSRVQANAPGLSFGLLKQFDGDFGALSLGAILNLRDTRLSPDDPGNKAEGFRVGIGPQLQWRASERQRLAGDLFANFISGRRSYFAKGFAGFRSHGGWAIGPEAWVIGDPRYQIRGYGLALRDLQAGPLRLGLRIGAEKQAGQDRYITGGIEFSWYRPD